jgi:hypothetical protein
MSQKIYLISYYGEYDEIKYKIGVSINPEKRLKQLQTGNSYKLKLENIYLPKKLPATKIENVLHNKYRHLNIKNEWFNLELNDVINFNSDCEKIENQLLLIN